jgi:hypothetical protein
LFITLNEKVQKKFHPIEKKSSHPRKNNTLTPTSRFSEAYCFSINDIVENFFPETTPDQKKLCPQRILLKYKLRAQKKPLRLGVAFSFYGKP